MQYVLCFVCGVFVYRVEIEVVEFVLVHVGEPLLVGVGAPLSVGTVGATCCSSSSSSDKAANATIVLIGTTSTDDHSAIAITATTTSSSPITTRRRNETDRSERPGADYAATIAVGAPETLAKLAERRLRRYGILNPRGDMPRRLWCLQLLLILFLVKFIGFVMVVFGRFLKHWIQLATTGTSATSPWTTGTRLGKRIGVLLRHGIIAVQI